MALMDFIKKQFIDIIQWTEEGDGTLAWRFPMRDMEIQNGGQLVVRESQMAIFVNEGKVADVFGPGTHKLTTQTLPVLTYLKNWDKLFESPFKSDVYFFSTRQQIDQKWGTPQPITIRDKDFGAVRLRAFGNYAFRVEDPKLFHTEISGTREEYTVADVEGQLRGLVLQNISTAIAASGIPFLDLASNQIEFAKALTTQLAPEMAKLGLKVEGMTVQSVSLPEELQKILDQKIGMGMVGNDMGKFMQYQTAQAIPKFAEGAGGRWRWYCRAMPWAWVPVWRWVRCWRKTCRPACRAIPRRRPVRLRRRRLPRSSPTTSLLPWKSWGISRPRAS
jgi:membrane protease subunit (stomatin/prohibitin family)